MIKRWKKIRRGSFIVVVVFSGFMFIPETVLTDWLGITTLQRRVVNLQNALFWQVRARVFSGIGQNDQIDEKYGQLLGMMKNGDVALNIANGKAWERHGYTLAGIRIRDVYRSALTVGALRDTTVRVDVYPEPRERLDKSVVIWAHGTPINLALIEDGHAIPEPRPVTNIMAEVYASYYWRLVKNGEASGDNEQVTRF
jgi:hypothetical protein